MKNIKKCTLIILVFILFTCSIFTSYASIADINGGGQGNNTAPSTEAWIGRYHAIQENNGIRMYLVNKNGVVISNQVDLVSYYPEQIETFNSELARIYNKYLNWTGAANDRPKKFRYHTGFKYDSVYYSCFTDLMYGYPKTKGSKGSFSDRQAPVSQKAYTYDMFEAFFEVIYNIEFPGAVSPISLNGGTVKTTDFRTGSTISIPRDIQGPVQRLKDGSGQEGTGDIFVNQLYKTCEDGLLVLERILDMQMPVYNIHGEEVGGLEPLFNFVYEDDIELLNQLNSVDGKNHIVEVVRRKGYKFCAEPLHWAVNEVVLPTAPNGLNGVDLNAFYWTPYVEYGTVSQISYLTYNWLWSATKTWLQLLGQYTSDVDVYQYLAQAGQSWDWSLAYTAYMLDNTDTELGMYSFYDCGIDPATAEQQRLKFWHDYAGNLGYGIIVTDITKGHDTGTSTFDEVNYGPNSPSGYKPGPSEDKSSDGGDIAKNNIVKFYANKYDDSSYDYLENHTRTDTVSQILLENEVNYKIDSWFASSDFRQPASPTDDYSDFKSSLPNKQSGGADANKTVTLDPSDTLYVRLIKCPEVIKIYESNGHVDKIVSEQDPDIRDKKYDIKDPDGGYDYTESLVSNQPSVNPDDWSDCIGDPTNDDPITISTDTTVVYIHYVKDSPISESGLVLHENEISHNFSISDITGDLLSTDRIYKSVTRPDCNYKWISGYKECSACRKGDYSNCKGGSCGDPKYSYCNSKQDEVDPGSYSFDLKNQESYAKDFVYMTSYSDLEYSGQGQGYNGFAITATPDMEFTLTRGFSDKPTLYPNKNNSSVKGVLSEMGITSEAYSPANDRYAGKTSQPTRKTWSTTFETDWQYKNVSNPTISFDHNGHDSDTKIQSSSGDTSNLNDAYSEPNNTTIYGLWGKPNTGTQIPSGQITSNKWKIDSMTFTSRWSEMEPTSNITFYPYYRMVYQTLSSSNKDVYLTSENLSTLLNLQRVDTAIFKSDARPGLNLQSYQWSMHAGIQNNLAEYRIIDRDSFLPSGAIYTLATGNEAGASDVYVGFRIYSTYVSDKTALQSLDVSILNKQEAESKIDSFMSQAKDVLDNYEIVMNGAVGLTVNESEFYSNSAQLTGRAGTYKLAGQKFDNDIKYDLQTNGSGSSRSDIDVLDELSKQYIWTLEADVDGNIVISKDGRVLETIRKTSSSISNPEVREFNEHTNMVTNFINALDRNLGSDRSNKTWYNEGFEINCIEHQQAFKLGFGGSDTLRSAALNIKANGLLDNRSDMYNLNPDTINEKARTYKFYTSMRSNISEASSKPVGWIGDFGTTQVIVPGIHELFTSKLFYTSNTTVHDLN